MWATVLVLALWMAAEPVRIAVAVLLISRPRPVLNLLAYWVGGMTAGVATAIGALLLLRDFVPTVMQGLTSTAASLTGGYVRIITGVLVLTFAALFYVRISTRHRAQVPAGVGAWSGPPSPPSTPTPFSRLSAGAGRVWQTGHPGVAFVTGLGSALQPVEFLVILTVILASGAALGTQIGAAVVAIVVMLAVIEIPLISYLVSPAKTLTVMQHMQSWLRCHSRRIFAGIGAALGILLIVTGVGGV